MTLSTWPFAMPPSLGGRRAGCPPALGAGSLALQAPAFATGPGRALLGLSPLPTEGWLLAGAAVIVAVPLIDVSRLVLRLLSRSSGATARPAEA